MNSRCTGPFETLRRQVIEAGLCTACGACVAVCSVGALRFGEDTPEPSRETPDESWPCDSCGRCLALCPALHIPVTEHLAAHELAGTADSPALGRYRGLSIAHAVDPEIRRRGASGGVGVALQQYLLSTGQVAGVLTTRYDSREPWRVLPFLATTSEQLLAGVQTKYQPSPVCALLDDSPHGSGPLVMTGLPCHLHGLRRLQMARATSRASAVRLSVGLFCGGMWSLEGTRTLLSSSLGVPLEDVRSIAYREGEPHPGSFRVERLDGRAHAVPYPDYFDLGLRQHLRSACRLCFDATSELADISIGDIGNVTDRKKWSAVVIRTEEGQRVFEEAVRAGCLIAEPIAEQPVAANYSVRRKKSLNLRHILAARERGQPTSDYPLPGREPAPLLLDGGPDQKP